MKAVWQRIHNVRTHHTGKLQRLLARTFATIQPNESELRQALARGEVERATNAFPWQKLHDLTPPLRLLFIATWQGGRTVALKKADTLAGLFDLVNPRAVLAAAQQAADLVTAIDEETRGAIRDIIQRGQSGELDIDAQVRLLKQLMGLNRPQANAAWNYLLARQEDNPDMADELTAKYVDRAVRLRSEMIARTETIRAANTGQQDAWAEAVQQGLIPSDSQQVWVASPDACDECEALDGESVPLGATFSSGDDGPPAHPNCRCALSLDTEALQEA